MKTKRSILDKLHTLLFGKDLRVTAGEPFTRVLPGDYYSYYPAEKYIDFSQTAPESCFDIRAFGADAKKSGQVNTAAVQRAIDECSANGGGTVLISGGSYTRIRKNLSRVLEVQKPSRLRNMGKTLQKSEARGL